MIFFLPYVNDYIELLVFFTALVKIFLNARVAKLDEMFVQHKISAVLYVCILTHSNSLFVFIVLHLIVYVCFVKSLTGISYRCI